MYQPTDTILLRLQGERPSMAHLQNRIASASLSDSLRLRLERFAWCNAADLGYLYLKLEAALAMDAGAVESIADAIRQGSEGLSVAGSRLSLMQDLAGASAGHEATMHYVVEMTPEAGWELELQNWYLREHLPGLAGVTGCVRASRYWNLDSGAASLACYDLVADSVLGSPQWLAVRRTPWSDRVRPRFMNPSRTMFNLESIQRSGTGGAPSAWS
jgi:hypothetical protein